MGQPQLAQHGPFFGLMLLHPTENIVQQPHGAEHVRSLVEHDTFRAVAHRRIRDLGPRRHAFLRQRFEDLRRPNHGNMGCLTEPEDFLLHLRQPFEAAFDGQIAASDHHAATGGSHGGQQHIRQILEPAPGLDLQHDGRLPIAQAREMVLKRFDILDRVRE